MHVDQNNYFADPNDLNELARLIVQSREHNLLNIFPNVQWSQIRDVLDIGCGPGGWCLDIAQSHSHLNATGIDVSDRMLAYAKMLASADSLQNVHFIKMDARNIEFPPESFDFIHLRFARSFLSKELYPEVLKRCALLLRPNGYIQLTEEELAVSTSAAFDQLDTYLNKAFQSTGYSPLARGQGITMKLRHFLKNIGLTNIETRAYVIDFSNDDPNASLWREVFLLQASTVGAFVITKTGVPQEEINHLIQEALNDMNEKDFAGLAYCLSVWGQRLSA